MRVKRQWRSAGKENYKEFCEKHPDKVISYSDWKKIIYFYNESFLKYILETGESVKIPQGLGELTIIKKKRKIKRGKHDEFMNLPLDWKKTKEKGKKVYILNYHTEGFFFGWKWFKMSAKFAQAPFFYFKIYRNASRELNHYLLKDNKYQHLYREWESVTRLSKNLKK